MNHTAPNTTNDIAGTIRKVLTQLFRMNVGAFPEVVSCTGFAGGLLITYAVGAAFRVAFFDGNFDLKWDMRAA